MPCLTRSENARFCSTEQQRPTTSSSSIRFQFNANAYDGAPFGVLEKHETGWKKVSRSSSRRYIIHADGIVPQF